jgi:putative ABC transport system permease protein
MRTVIIASMRTYARRYVAALLAVVIATAFIVSITALSAAARQGSQQAVDDQYGRVDLAIIPRGDVAAAIRDARRIAESPGIAVATNWQAYADVHFPEGSQSVELGSVATAPDLRWQRAATGHLPSSDDQIAISSKRARSEGLSIGDTVTLAVPGDTRTLTVTGTVDAPQGPLSATGYLTEHALADLTAVAYPIDTVVATRGSTTAIAEKFNAVSGDEYRRQLQLEATRGIDVFQKLIYVFAGISLFVGALVIANTFTILLAQRARDLALLRCIGAVRSQVARSVVIEGVLLGAVGSLLGVALGLGIALAGTSLIGSLSPETPMGTPALSLAAILVPVLLGIGVTAGGAYLPAQRAGAQSPLAALQPQDVVELRSRSGMLRLAMAGALILTGAAGLMAGLAGSLAAGMLGGMLSFIGVLLLTPVIVPGAIALAGPAARRLGLAGRLAHVNSLRNPRRTAATSTALLIGVTLITAVVVGSASISHKVNTSVDTNNPVDLIASTSSSTVPKRVVADISRIDGVAASKALPGADVLVGGHKTTVLAVTPATLALVHGAPEFSELKKDEIVLPFNSTLASPDENGESVTVTVGDQTRRLKVLFAGGLGDAPLVNRTTLDSMGAHTTGYRAVWIRAAADADAEEVTSAVTAVAKTSDLDTVGGLRDRADIVKILDVVLAVTIGLLAIAVLIALIGVGNTLSLSVLERVRENSLLRALGLGRSGLRRMLAIEALLMAGVAAVLGILLGTTYAWFGIKTVSIGVFGSSPTLTIPWERIGLILVVAALAGLLACVLPARRATHIPPAAGLVAD